MSPEPLNNKPRATKSELQKLDQKNISLDTGVDNKTSSACDELVKNLKALHHEVVIVKWMIAFALVGVVVLLIKTFRS